MIAEKKLILIVACTAVFFEALDIAIINLAMPLIQEQFRLTAETVQWLQTLYVLFYGGFLIIGGKLADAVGRKFIFMTGSVVFLITSLGAGLSSSFEVLAVFRALQGLGAALVMPSALSIVTNTFTEPRERGKAIGVFSSFAAIGSGSGLCAGGFIATYLGWEWVFFINVPVIGIALWAGYLFIARDVRTAKQQTPDVLSGVLLTVVIVMLSYIVHELYRIRTHYVLLPTLGIFTVMGAWIFITRTKRSVAPLIDFSLFKNESSLTGNVGMMLMGAFFTGYLFILPMILQRNMNYSAADAGVLLFPFTVLSALVSKSAAPALLKRISPLQLGILGMSVMLAGALLLLSAMWMQYDFTLLVLSIACITGCGIALGFTAFTIMAIHPVPEAQHGVASSISATSYFLGSGTGLSVIGLFLQLGSATQVMTTIPVIVLAVFALADIAWLIFRQQTIPSFKTLRTGSAQK